MFRDIRRFDPRSPAFHLMWVAGAGNGENAEMPTSREADQETERAARSGAFRLSELTTTRLCHDLAGPIGTISAALAMIDEEPDAADEARAIAAEAADSAVWRIRFLRAAWGAGAPSMSLAEMRTLARGLPGRDLCVDLDGPAADEPMAPEMTRVLLNALLLAAESLPAGGHIGVAAQPGGGLVVTIAGPRAGWPGGFAGFAADPPRAWAALDTDEAAERGGMQAPLTVLMASLNGVRLSLPMGGIAAPLPAPLLIEAAAS
jgi:histidine phosphotransferase ChpT